jgi:hypothetical protein
MRPGSALTRTKATWPAGGTTPAPAGSPAGSRSSARIETASLEEWEDFESGYQCDEEEWLATHGAHPRAAGISERVNQHRSFWLRGYYGLLGQAYLTLVPVG